MDGERPIPPGHQIPQVQASFYLIKYLEFLLILAQRQREVKDKGSWLVSFSGYFLDVGTHPITFKDNVTALVWSAI